MLLKQFFSKQTILLIGIATYVLALPYAIIAFNIVLQMFSLGVAKQLPVMVFACLAVAYGVVCWRRKQGFYLLSFIIPSLVVVAGVVLLESNPIKYSHIPEYMLLAVLIYAANSHGKNTATLYLGCFLSTVLLGIFDEVHHGIHPERYYGWKDMVINAAGGFIGLLLVAQVRPVPVTGFWQSVCGIVKKQGYAVALLMLALLILAFSCAGLFQVQSNGAFLAVYSKKLLLLNAATVCCIIIFAVHHYKTSQLYSSFMALLYQPLIVIGLIQALLVWANLTGVEFK